MQGYSKCDGTFDVLWLTPPVANWRVLSLGPATRKHEEKSHHHYAWQKLLHLPQEQERTLTGFYSIPSTFILSVPARESSNRVPGRAHHAALEDQTMGLTRAHVFTFRAHQYARRELSSIIADPQITSRHL